MIPRRLARRTPRGAALVNALVIMAALAMIATVLLTRAQGALDRLDSQQRADQAVLYLDGAEALARQLVGRADTPHSRAQDWAQPRLDEEIDRGRAGWRIDDLQGRFNLNWLQAHSADAGAAGWDAAAALERLLRALELPDTAVWRLADAASADPRRRAAAFEGAAVGPPPRPAALLRQLHGLPGIEAAHWRRLAPHVTALPPETTLNVNTASLPVLGAALPLLDQRALDAIDSRRRVQPFESGSDFIAWVDRVLGIALQPAADDNGDLAGDQPPDQAPPIPPLDGASEWFEAELSARLDSIVVHRTVVLHRDRPGAAARSWLTWHGSD